MPDIAGDKKKGERKIRCIPIAVAPAAGLVPGPAVPLKKPQWIRVRAAAPGSRFHEVKQILRQARLHTVCEEASCPNIGECFGKGTATFMILGDICTRRCPFCDVGHGRPLAPDAHEPLHLAQTIASLALSYVVITSVDRDDLKDGGAQHFVDCIRAVREHSPATTIEVLVPDFRGRMERALEVLDAAPPDIMNHNLETVPRLYREARPGGDYLHSLALLKRFKARHPSVPTKSGLMVGLGETDAEILEVMRDLRRHNVDMLTIGQYLQPSRHHLAVLRFVIPEVFAMFEREARAMGFEHAAVGPMVRSSYHADEQAHAAGVAGVAKDRALSAGGAGSQRFPWTPKLMSIDWAHFTPWSAVAGGLLVGLAAALLVLLNGRVAGVSGIVGDLLGATAGERMWRAAFIAGLLLAPLAWAAFASLPKAQIDAGTTQLIIAGLLVGVGTRYAGGCTSGHGVCGLARLSPRSLLATMSFMAAGFATIYVLRHLIGR